MWSLQGQTEDLSSVPGSADLTTYQEQGTGETGKADLTYLPYWGNNIVMAVMTIDSISSVTIECV